MELSKKLKYYKRNDIQEQIIEHVKDREVAVQFDEGFGTRPSILRYENDILELAKDGATSFHCSEERWKNPLQLETGLHKNEMDEMRKGWDLVLDIDCKSWKYSKLITYLLVRLIKKFGIDSISVKYSGNKGFHIGVPFEAFPQKVKGRKTEELFPQGPKKIAKYLVQLLEKKFLKEYNNLTSKKDIAEKLGLNLQEITINKCKKCGEKRKETGTTQEFICPSCNNRETTEEDLSYKECEECGKLMNKTTQKNIECSNCGGTEYQQTLDTKKILEVDTLLISSRHLYRAPYSLHEKSGLASLPIKTERILDFDKKEAKPEKIEAEHTFLERDAEEGEGKQLLMQALDASIEEENTEKKEIGEVEVPDSAIDEDDFPECIKTILEGLEDGRKRALFILINFLRSVGWSMDNVEKLIWKWNKRNNPSLNENYVKNQLEYAKDKKPFLPPNCHNESYYADIGVKCNEKICSKCKNPVQKAKMNNEEE